MKFWPPKTQFVIELTLIKLALAKNDVLNFSHGYILCVQRCFVIDAAYSSDSFISLVFQSANIQINAFDDVVLDQESIVVLNLPKMIHVERVSTADWRCRRIPQPISFEVAVA